MVRPGYKQTEVGEIPEDWYITEFGDLVTYTKGYAFKSSEYLDHGIRVIRVSDTTFNSISDNGAVFISEDSRNQYKKWTLRESDLIFSTVGSKPPMYDSLVGKVIYITQAYARCLLNQNAVLIRARKFSKEFQILLLNHFRTNRYIGYIEIIYRGNANQASITLEDLFQYKIPLPSKSSEQNAIAKALSDVDELIVSLEKLITKKHDIKTATMQQLLTGKKRLPGFGEGKGYKQTELGEIPEDWEVRSIGQVTTVTRGASPRPIDSPIWFDSSSTVGWLRISDVTKTNKYLYETTQNLSEKGIANSRFVPSNNLVMSICATVGRPILTRKDVCIHDGFVVFSKLYVNMEYLYYVLSDIEDQWSKHGQTGSQMNLNTGLINNTCIPVPSLKEEQDAIAKVLSDIDIELNALNHRLSKNKAIKQGMMQELLTGRTRLVEPQAAYVEEERLHGT
jgi:type I restriction enzyme S subunit